MKTHV